LIEVQAKAKADEEEATARDEAKAKDRAVNEAKAIAVAEAKDRAKNVKHKLENDNEYKKNFLSLLWKIRALKMAHKAIFDRLVMGEYTKLNGLVFLYTKLRDKNQDIHKDIEVLYKVDTDDIRKIRVEMQTESELYKSEQYQVVIDTAQPKSIDYGTIPDW